MGKATGFLEYKRQDRPGIDPAERVKNFREFHDEIPVETRREQGARCMSCGVPFCQSDFGCPLHNLIPEWNDEIYNGNWAHAMARLLKTNNFPEFTGRVCPALCEAACTCGMHDGPVSVRDNELSVIEYAYAHGLIKPRIPAVRTGKRVAVIGSGPAGLAAADTLNQRGHSVTIYEKADRPGGLLMYGIPNMKLEKDIITRRVALMEAEQVEFITGTQVGTDISGEELLESFDAVVLCCGARKPRELGVDCTAATGVYQALDYLTESTAAVLSGTESVCTAKGKDVIIVGNGDTATDCLATAIRQGAASVTQLVRRSEKELIKEAVWPHRGSGLTLDYGHEEALAVFGSDPRLYEASVLSLNIDSAGALTAVVAQKAGEEVVLPAGMLLIAAGFSGAEEETAAAFDLSLDANGRLGGEDHLTASEKVFAAGDMRHGASLVATAIADGQACAKQVDKYLEGYTNL